MRDQRISVIIAERPYRLTVNSEGEEQVFRKAAGLVGEKMQDYAKNFAYRDNQDLLAMVNLQFAVEYLRLASTAKEQQLLIDRLKALDTMLDHGLNTTI